MASLDALQRVLGHSFADSALFKRALTHRSAAGENNERLEFLGDSIVNHVVAQELFLRFPKATEGEMSRMRSSLVKGDTLAEMAREFNVGEHLLLGPGERKSGGYRRASILADTLEALAAAILLDAGYETCKDCLSTWFSSRLDQLSAGETDKDAKTRLQEYLQGRRKPLPVYELIAVQGEDHDKLFHASCAITKPQLISEGWGKSRRKAEQAAAEHALEKLNAREK